MSVVEWCVAVRNGEFFTAVRESELVYPTVLAIHLTCIAIFGGMILATNLRLMGVAFTGTAIRTAIASMRRWKQAGFLVMATTGVLLAGSKLDRYYPNPYFLAKLCLLCVVWAHGRVFREVYRGAEEVSVGRARAAGVLSTLLWLALISCGRWIAYWDPPEAIARMAIARLMDQLPAP